MRLALPLALALLAGCQPPPSPKRKVALEACTLQGSGRKALCGVVPVALDRAKPERGNVPLRVVVLPATGSSPRPDPLFLLAGGPGQASSEAFGPLLPLLSRIGQTRDIVLVDQRGTGASAPLDCPDEGTLAERLRAGALARTAKACWPTHRDRAPFHTTRAAADDLDAVRDALGYVRINLYGISYGTRLALTYARHHGKHLRAMAIDGVAPPGMRIPVSFARDADEALAGQATRCLAEPACKARFGDLRTTLQTTLGRLEKKPEAATLRHPRTGAPVALTMTRDLFASSLRGLLYSPELATLLPHTLERSAASDYQAFVAQVTLLGESAEDAMSLGLFLSVICAEDVSRLSDRDDKASAGTFLGGTMLSDMRDACAAWPVPAAPPDVDAPVASDVPTLISSGAFDPVTPKRWGDLAAETLPRSRHVVVPGAGHGTLQRGCMRKVLRRFLDSADAKSLDVSCLDSEAAAPFFVDKMGPPP